MDVSSIFTSMTPALDAIRLTVIVYLIYGIILWYFYLSESGVEKPL